MWRFRWDWNENKCAHSFFIETTLAESRKFFGQAMTSISHPSMCHLTSFLDLFESPLIWQCWNFMVLLMLAGGNCMGWTVAESILSIQCNFCSAFLSFKKPNFWNSWLLFVQHLAFVECGALLLWNWNMHQHKKSCQWSILWLAQAAEAFFLNCHSTACPWLQLFFNWLMCLQIFCLLAWVDLMLANSWLLCKFSVTIILNEFDDCGMPDIFSLLCFPLWWALAIKWFLDNVKFCLRFWDSEHAQWQCFASLSNVNQCLHIHNWPLHWMIDSIVQMFGSQLDGIQTMPIDITNKQCTETSHKLTLLHVFPKENWLCIWMENSHIKQFHIRIFALNWLGMECGIPFVMHWFFGDLQDFECVFQSFLFLHLTVCEMQLCFALLALFCCIFSNVLAGFMLLSLVHLLAHFWVCSICVIFAFHCLFVLNGFVNFHVALLFHWLRQIHFRFANPFVAKVKILFGVLCFSVSFCFKVFLHFHCDSLSIWLLWKSCLSNIFRIFAASKWAIQFSSNVQWWQITFRADSMASLIFVTEKSVFCISFEMENQGQSSLLQILWMNHFAWEPCHFFILRGTFWGGQRKNQKKLLSFAGWTNDSGSRYPFWVDWCVSWTSGPRKRATREWIFENDWHEQDLLDTKSLRSIIFSLTNPYRKETKATFLAKIRIDCRYRHPPHHHHRHYWYHHVFFFVVVVVLARCGSGFGWFRTFSSNAISYAIVTRSRSLRYFDWVRTGTVSLTFKQIVTIIIIETPLSHLSIWLLYCY